MFVPWIVKTLLCRMIAARVKHELDEKKKPSTFRVDGFRLWIPTPSGGISETLNYGDNLAAGVTDRVRL
jgi:hypothetical protein